jgi:hypothetical protein
MSRVSRDKYFPNEGKDLVDEVLRRNANLERRISDLERALANQDTPPAIPRIDPTTYPEPYEGQRAIDITDEQHTWYSDGEWRKAAAGGVAIYEIKIFEDVNEVIVGDGAFWWPIPEDLGDAEIVKVEAGVSDVSSSGSVQVQLRHFTSDGTNDSGDILTNKITIEAGERNSRQATTQPSITGGTRAVSHGDWLRCDVDAAGVGAFGLALIVGLTPSPLGSVTVEGAQGPPGSGVTNWTGAWTTATGYTTGDSVSAGGTTYVAIQNHTSGATSEPGVGANWEDYWQVLQSGHTITTLAYVINGNAQRLDTGVKGPGLPIYFDCEIVEATLLADIVGSVVLDIWNDTYGAYPPTDADSITSSSPLTLSNAIKTTDTALTGWSTSLQAGDTLRFNIDSVTAITSLTVGLKLERL